MISYNSLTGCSDTSTQGCCLVLANSIHLTNCHISQRRRPIVLVGRMWLQTTASYASWITTYRTITSGMKWGEIVINITTSHALIEVNWNAHIYQLTCPLWSLPDVHLWHVLAERSPFHELGCRIHLHHHTCNAFGDEGMEATKGIQDLVAHNNIRSLYQLHFVAFSMIAQVIYMHFKKTISW